MPVDASLRIICLQNSVLCSDVEAFCLWLSQVLLSIQRVQREMPSADAGSRGADADTGANRGALKVSSCQAYDYLLLAALRAQVPDCCW